ncbi:MAG TPA: ATP-binding protein, partial [Pyrinomonadaceae bacterium]|nr:ATP-binding protein [Pyrinomonadaceae bacterium]
KDYERHRAAEAVREGSNLYVMKALFEATDFEQKFRSLKEQLDAATEVISTSAKMEADKIQFQILYAAPIEKIRVETVFQQAVLAGKSLAARLGKEITFVVGAGEHLLNRLQADALADALLHLVRNAVDHGIESRGKVTLGTQTSSGTLRVFVSDNGRGIASANLPLIFEPGFSTATEVTELSGRGVGLDAVKAAVEQFGGTVTVTSEPGRGSSFEIKLPNPSSDA